MNYITAVFVNHTTKQFSATARKADNSNLSKMISDEAAKGFTFHTLWEGQSEEEAKVNKQRIMDVYRVSGYEQVARPV